MNLLEIKKVRIPRKNSKRVGRGSGSGKGRHSGRGIKGQNSRSGVTFSPVSEGATMPLYRRLPKRGFNNTVFQEFWVEVNIGQLNAYKDGDEVTLETLAKNKVIKVPKSKKCKLKVLANGELTVKNLKIKTHKISAKAKELLEKANGTIEIVKIPKFKRPRRKSL